MELYSIPARLVFKRWAGSDAKLTARFRLRNGGSQAVSGVSLRPPTRSKRFELAGAQSLRLIEPGEQVVYTVTFVPPAADSRTGNYQDAAVFTANGEVLCVMLQAIRDGVSAAPESFSPKASEIIPATSLQTGRQEPAAAHTSDAAPPQPSGTARPRSARASRGVTEAQRVGGRAPAVMLHPRLRDMCVPTSLPPRARLGQADC